MEKRLKLPDDVAVDVKDRHITVSGPKGTLSRDFADPRFDDKINIEKSGSELVVLGPDKRKMKSMIGTIISHVNNMIAGVKNGHTYRMRIVFTHFPITVEVKEKKVLVRNFLGEKGARAAKVRGEVDIRVQKDEIILSGVNKEHVSQTAANIEKACKLSKRDRRIFTDGIFMVR